MNVTGQFALSLAEGYNRYGCPCRKFVIQSVHLPCFSFGDRNKKMVGR
jgi:hypothetical protein